VAPYLELSQIARGDLCYASQVAELAFDTFMMRIRSRA
jgi:hypothetical protein